MYLSRRSIEGYIHRIMEKFGVDTRVGIVLEAIRRNIIIVDSN